VPAPSGSTCNAHYPGVLARDKWIHTIQTGGGTLLACITKADKKYGGKKVHSFQNRLVLIDDVVLYEF
jgi:hypothetical protein